MPPEHPAFRPTLLMPSKNQNVLIAPYARALPAPIFFRSAPMPDDGLYPAHTHPWGEFVYAVSGVVEVRFEGGHYLVPPQYGIWLPPDIKHLGQNRRAAWHSSVYVDAGLCGNLPEHATALLVTPLVREMMEYLRQHPPAIPSPEREQRFLQVLIELLADAEQVGTYLPTSNDPIIQKILSFLESAPGDASSLAELANYANTSERTLIRRCRQSLGMSLVEWRQRLRVVKSMQSLEEGNTVENIALDLGYASSSAFIAMFRRLTGETPDEYRKRTRV
jgi:AraC-like DNA-binding protein